MRLELDAISFQHRLNTSGLPVKVLVIGFIGIGSKSDIGRALHSDTYHSICKSHCGIVTYRTHDSKFFGTLLTAYRQYGGLIWYCLFTIRAKLVCINLICILQHLLTSAAAKSRYSSTRNRFAGKWKRRCYDTFPTVLQCYDDSTCWLHST